MKKRIIIIVTLIILVFLLITTIYFIRYKTYNNIEENWIIKITPNYLNQPPNTLYLYENSYIITNCFTVTKFQNRVHKKGTLTNKINENLIIKIKQEAKKEFEKGEVALLFSVTLKSGEEFTLTAASESINEIIDMINYEGTIWYVQDYQ